MCKIFLTSTGVVRPCVCSLPLHPILVCQQLWLPAHLQAHPLRLPGLCAHQQKGLQLKAKKDSELHTCASRPMLSHNALAVYQCNGNRRCQIQSDKGWVRRRIAPCLFAISGVRPHPRLWMFESYYLKISHPRLSPAHGCMMLAASVFVHVCACWALEVGRVATAAAKQASTRHRTGTLKLAWSSACCTCWIQR